MQKLLVKRMILILGIAVLFLIGGSTGNPAVAGSSDDIWVYGSISPRQANTYGVMTPWNINYEVWALDGTSGRIDWGSLEADERGNYVIKLRHPKRWNPGVQLIITVPKDWNNWDASTNLVLYSEGIYCSQLTAPTINVSQIWIR